MITGSVYIPLAAETDVYSSHDRQALAVLERCPDGARVIVDIGRRQFVTYDVAYWLHEHDHRLAIEITGQNPGAVAQFIAAARAGDPAAVA